MINIFKLNKMEMLIVLLVVVYAITAFLLYPLMPSTIATHWNAFGVANGFSPWPWEI